MKIIRIRCIKDGYNITKGNLYDIRVQDHDTAKYILNSNTGVKITDDKGGTRYYLSEYFIDVDDKQTWRNLQLEELI